MLFRTANQTHLTRAYMLILAMVNMTQKAQKVEFVNTQLFRHDALGKNEILNEPHQVQTSWLG